MMALDGIIARSRRRAAERILGHYRERYLPFTVLAPSGRFGLYATCRELLAPGDRVIVSPITCRTVVEALLAAGVRPVFVDIELETGNMDVTRLPVKLLKTAKAMLTTNLYGNPDRVVELAEAARAHGLWLIEDCAHVLRSSISGRAVGAVGNVSVFSFKKYFDQPGGIVTTSDETLAQRIRDRIARETGPPPRREEALRFVQYHLAQRASARAASWMGSAYRRLTVARRPPAGRSPQTAPDPGRQRRSVMPTTASLLRVAASLSQEEKMSEDRAAQTNSLVRDCPLPLKRSPYADQVCYLAVPFFSANRNAIVQRLEQKGIPTYFVYNPPMNVVFRQQADTSHRLDEGVVREWSKRILPVNLKFSSEYLEAIQSLG